LPVAFYIFGNYDAPIPQIEKAITIIVAATSIITTSALLILRKMRKSYSN
jgi:hypothetical protein